MTTIAESASTWLDAVSNSRQRKTFETYRCAYHYFAEILDKHGTNVTKKQTSDLSLKLYTSYIEELQRHKSVATERLYLTAIRQFYKFLVATEVLTINIPAMDQIIKTRARRMHIKLPEFPEKEVMAVLAWVDRSMPIPKESGRLRLRALRDRAFLLTLADTGLRVGEACRLKRGHIAWDAMTADVIGKNGDEAVIHFTQRSLYAMQKYLGERAPLDGATGRELISQPIFSRHDRAAGKKVTPITTTAGRSIVKRVVSSALQVVKVKITPHKFRHYFCTMVYNETNDLHLTMTLARHKNMEMTTRYTHRNDKQVQAGYRKATKNK